jgi:hypothetical protein
MPWSKTTLTAEEVSAGKDKKLHEEFWELFEANGEPLAAAVFWDRWLSASTQTGFSTAARRYILNRVTCFEPSGTPADVPTPTRYPSG